MALLPIILTLVVGLIVVNAAAAILPVRWVF